MLNEQMYECDGRDCSVAGTLEEVEKHILADAKLPDGNLKPVNEIRCWGAVGVGRHRADR